jgi:hypothetical protein
MTQAWLVLTRPDGRDVAAPSEAQLAAALSDVYGGNTISPDGGPGSAVLRFGYDDGLMYEMEVSSGGAVRFAEWSDRDCEIALASPRTMTVKQQADKIRSQPWLNND